MIEVSYVGHCHYNTTPAGDFNTKGTFKNIPSSFLSDFYRCLDTFTDMMSTKEALNIYIHTYIGHLKTCS